MNSTGGISKQVTALADSPKSTRNRSSRNTSSRKLTTWSLAAVGVFTLGMSMAASQPPKPQPLAANDVSILFPAPRNAKDLANLIPLSTLNGPGGTGRVWSDADFKGFIATAENPKIQVADTQLQLPAEVRQIDAWFIAGIRIDPGAPGLSKEIIDQFGQQPQIRLIAQPVTRGPGGTVRVHDIAAHLIFSYAVPPKESDPPAAESCFPRPKPDMAAFQPVIRDTVALRDQLASGKFGKAKVRTAGPLNVHPGLVGASAVPFRNALKGFLETHLASARISAMAIMGLNGPDPEPWIFIAMVRPAPGAIFPVPGPMLLDETQFGQMLDFRGGPKVVPTPVTNNQNKITCLHGALKKPQPTTERKGVATAEFLNGDASEARIREIVDIIADPKQSHFFNTDCISCHTDTAQPRFRFKAKFKVDGVAEAVLPRDDWNVRNFGWFASAFRPGPPVPTATRRTATETAEVVEFINQELLGK